MSIIGSNILAGASGQGGAYEIEQSLRFNSADSAHLYEAVGTSTPTDGTKATVSLWVKRGKLDNNGHILSVGSTSNSTYCNLLYRSSSDTFRWIQQGGAQFDAVTTAVYRDCSAWYHIVLVFDTNNATAASRNKLYINNQLVTLSAGPSGYGTNPSQTSSNGVWFTCPVGTAANNYRFIGALASGSGSGTTSGYYLDGYTAEAHLIDGYTGSHGTNGYYLKFDPSATNGIGHDHSGNGNNFTPTSFTTSGTGTDVMSDTPTTNYATLNPTLPSLLQVKDGNLICDSTNRTTNYTNTTLATMGVSSGKWYYEATVDSGSMIVGWAKAGVNLDYFLGVDSLGWSYSHSGQKWNNNSAQTYGATYTTGDVIGCALDLSAGTLEFFKNGTSQGVAFTGLSGEFFPGIGDGSSSTSVVATVNFGQRAFAYTPPTGYKALNTANLPAPDIADGSQYFNTVLYTGNGTGSSQAVTGVGFQPELVWIKARSFAGAHKLVDAVRGADKFLESSSTAAESTTALNSFDSDGFTITGSSGFNNGTETFAAWCWDAGGSGSSNTDGSITSTVSANPSAGFSIVTYTGTGSAATVGHGLGVAPAMIITKYRNATGYDWYVYHKNVTSGKYLRLNTTEGEIGPELTLYSSAPSSTVINYGSSVGVVANGGTYVAYCFAEVEGYSKFGSYTGNGSTDGPFVFCNFRPAWVLTKRTDSTSAWYLHDTVRNTYNVVNLALSPDLSDAEVSANNNLDILSNGFKLRTSGAWMNASGGTYIFMALAENPFGGDGVSPATAR
jgi:hypothetical protein